jgi:hypothetical protein
VTPSVVSCCYAGRVPPHGIPVEDGPIIQGYMKCVTMVGIGGEQDLERSVKKNHFQRKFRIIFWQVYVHYGLLPGGFSGDFSAKTTLKSGTNRSTISFLHIICCTKNQIGDSHCECQQAVLRPPVRHSVRQDPFLPYSSELTRILALLPISTRAELSTCWTRSSIPSLSAVHASPYGNIVAQPVIVSCNIIYSRANIKNDRLQPATTYELQL